MNTARAVMPGNWPAPTQGARYVRQPVALPVHDDAAILEEFWQGVTAQTRVIYLSHITSPTAWTLPIAAICPRARRAGILTVIDGTHAPGQMNLDLASLGADAYTGNLHKWLCAPKGAGFLWVQPHLQPRIEPLVTSWGFRRNAVILKKTILSAGAARSAGHR